MIAYLLFYVDDRVLTSNTPTYLDHLIQQLNTIFDLKNLDTLHYFLGLQVSRTVNSFYIKQTKYAQDLLKKHNMLNCKPATSHAVPTPDCPFMMVILSLIHMVTKAWLELCIISLSPSLTFAVHQVCQYMSAPTTTHLAATKRVLLYIRGTLNHGIEFTSGPLSLFAYIDTDWAGDPDD